MTQRARPWQAELRAAMDDEAICAVLGRAILALYATEDRPTTPRSPAQANARLHALSFACYEAIIRCQWWERHARDGGGEQPLPQIALADIAQQLCYDVGELSQLADRIAFAQLAIQLDPDCADAFIILAEEQARTLPEKRKLYEQAVQAGRRAIGGVQFDEWRGHFWGVIQTRPYMRARAGLAEWLWRLGEHKAAIKHVQELLRLNPNDNLGLRYDLASWLLSVEDDMGFAALSSQWLRTLAASGGSDTGAEADEGEGARWLYPRALFAFRQHGPGPEAEQILSRALASNAHVGAYLLGLLAPPSERPEHYPEGSVEEAAVYAIDGWQSWAKTPGALYWLGEHLPKAPGRGRRSTRGKAR